MSEFPSVEQFQQWLRLHGDELVGVTCDGHHCPLANWLTEVHGVPARAGLLSYGDVSGRERYPLPEWASGFVGCLDSAYGSGVEVVGSQAASVLDVVLREPEIAEIVEE